MASDHQTTPVRPPDPLDALSTSCLPQYNIEDLSEIVTDQDRCFALDIEWKVVGQMLVDAFLDKFLPCRDRVPKLRGVNFSGVPDKPTGESMIYPSLREGLNKILEKSDSTLGFYDTSNRSESPDQVGSSKPDLGMFKKSDVSRGKLEDTRKRVRGGASEEYVYTAHMGEIYMFIEVKTSRDLDFFTDPYYSTSDDGISPDNDMLSDDDTSSDGGTLSDDSTSSDDDMSSDDETLSEYRFTIDTSKEYLTDRRARYRVSALGQNTHYAHIIQTRQFRTCVYSISIAGATARLLRWDQSGVVVTESFNYKINPELLIGFIWRFSKATAERRGFDLSAIPVNSNAERQQFVDAIRKHALEQLPELSAKDIEKEVDRHYWPGAITRLTIMTGMDVWVSRPILTSEGVAGRSAVGYWGVRCDSGEVVFVKDVWRTQAPEVDMEGTILEELQKAGVRNIPELVCHGDIFHEGNLQTTRTDEFVEEAWVESRHPTDKRHRPIKRVHYRLVTKNAGFRLSTFKGTRGLLEATFDAFTAIMDAHSKAKMLHRDPSVDNIILYRPPGKPIRVGYLVDWEMSCKGDRKTARDYVLAGTPTFVSIAASQPWIPHAHNLEDDLESMLYVVLYCAVLWLRVKFPWEPSRWSTEFFSVPAGLDGSPGKLLNAITRFYTGDLTTERSQAVLDWLNAAMNLHYDPDTRRPNPAWDDGKALETLWKETLAKELPDDDRRTNPIQHYSLHATYTVDTTSGTLYDSRDVLSPLSPPAATTTLTSAKRSLCRSSGSDNSADSFNRNPNRQWRRPDEEGEVDARGGKLRRTDPQTVMPPPPVSCPSRRTCRPLPTEGRVTRSSTRQTAGKTGAVSTPKPTAISAIRSSARRTTKK